MTNQEQFMLESVYHNSQEMLARQEGERLDMLGSLALSNDLANDTIRIALKTTGCANVDSMSQFAKASALLDMAQENVANRESLAHYEYVFDEMGRAIANVRKRGTL